MARHGENIYKRKDGRYEGRYVTGKTIHGRTRFGLSTATSMPMSGADSFRRRRNASGTATANAAIP